MARQRTERAGHRWQPRLRGQPVLVAGRTRANRRVPRVRLETLRAYLARDRARTRRVKRAAVAAVVAGGALFALWALYQSPFASVRGVEVQGASVLTVSVVRDVAGLDDDNLLTPDFDGARERLLSLPMVKDAEVERDWPFGARITITERTAWGVWEAGGQRYVIDNEGVVVDLPAPKNAPVIVERQAVETPAIGDALDTDAIAVARLLVPTAERTLGRRVARLEFSDANGLTVVLASADSDAEVRVLFGGADSYEFKIAALYQVLRRAEEEGETVRRVDLRFGERVAVLTGGS